MEMSSAQMNAVASQSSNLDNANFSKDRNSVSMTSVQNPAETSGI